MHKNNKNVTAVLFRMYSETMALQSPYTITNENLSDSQTQNINFVLILSVNVFVSVSKRVGMTHPMRESDE